MNIFFEKEIDLGSKLSFRIPSKHDPRFLIVLLLFLYVFYGILNPTFVRTYPQYFTVLFTCLLTDLLLQLYLNEKITVFPLSSIITAHGIFLLVHSPYLWPYAFVSFISIFFKFFLRYKNKHIFNPNNLGIVIALLLFGQMDLVINPGVWQGSNWVMIIILLFGSYIVFKVDRHFLVLSFVATFLLCSLGFTYFLLDGQSWYYFFPLTGPAYQLYLFYMITDPQTSPAIHKRQVIAGVTLGLLDAFFRLQEEKYSHLYASTLNVGLHFSYNYITSWWESRSTQT